MSYILLEVTCYDGYSPLMTQYPLIWKRALKHLEVEVVLSLGELVELKRVGLIAIETQFTYEYLNEVELRVIEQTIYPEYSLTFLLNYRRAWSIKLHIN